jgi:hypothetical protein
MNTFVLDNIGANDGEVKFFKLVENGKCLHDEFFKEVESNGGHDSDLDYICAIIERKSRNLPVAPKLFKELKRDGSDKIKDYEIRKNRLRLYVFKCDDGFVSVLGGLKTGIKDQNRDIAKMRLIKNRYIASKS